MGLDYSILCFFEKQDPWQILDGAAEFADHGLKTHTAIQYPNKIMRLPFEAWAGTETSDPIPYDDEAKSWEFMTSLLFKKDEFVSDYADQYDLDEGPEQTHVSIGYVYLSAYRHWTGYEGTYDPALVLLQFAAASSNMSLLFAQSHAVRKPFIRLLEHYHGLYGVIDNEMDGILFWHRNKVMDVRIPDAWGSLREIDGYLDKYR